MSGKFVSNVVDVNGDGLGVYRVVQGEVGLLVT